MSPTTRLRPVLLAGLLAVAMSALADQTELERCIGELRPTLLARGISAAVFDDGLAEIEFDPGVLERLDFQPEFRTPIWDYLAGLVDAQRIEDGRRLLAEHAELLEAIEARYRVDPAVLVAIWGVESDYGRIFGNRPVLRSLATLSCFGRRQSFFRGELEATLRILAAGDVEADRLVGSWAGAFGQTQFMPSTFLRIAVDFDGDGRRDLFDSLPDVLASTAHYLRQSRWRHGEPWGIEVALPQRFDASLIGRTRRRSLADWQTLGLRPLANTAWPLPLERQAGLIRPAGDGGPAFLVFANFDALFSYNAAESYALAIAHLADRIRGADSFQTPWPTDDPGLSRAERREVQQRLAGLGYDIGEIDGLIGSRTRAAIAQFHLAQGIEAEPRAGQRLLDALRRASAETEAAPSDRPWPHD